MFRSPREKTEISRSVMKEAVGVLRREWMVLYPIIQKKKNPKTQNPNHRERAPATPPKRMEAIQDCREKR